MVNNNKLILDLCGGSGAWSKPYAEAGYRVKIIDIRENTNLHQKQELIKMDVRGFNRLNLPPMGKVTGILAAPPCTHLASSGARWWKEKGEAALLEALSIVDACLRIVLINQPQWWALENPVGRLIYPLGPPVMYFNPCDFGDPWTKKTCLWGNFNIPHKLPVEPTQGSKIHLMPASKDRTAIRSLTPPGFAKAFFEANP